VRYHVAGSGPACVVHSGGPGIAWEYMRAPLLEQHLTMVYVEVVGTGDSGRLADARDYDLATYTRFLHAVVTDLGVPRVALLGHSHGGFVVQQYALQHPETVSGLVLYDTSPVTGEEFWKSALTKLHEFADAHKAEHPEVETYVEKLSAPIGELDDDGATDVLRTILPAYVADYWDREAEFAPLRQAIQMTAAPSRGEGPPFDVRPQLPSITTPTLILVGDRDFICGTRWADMLHSGIPGSRLVTFPNTGHMGHVEVPVEFAEAVVKFLGSS
jgi:proline iminopeptidase